MRKGFIFIDTGKCLTCKSCEIACAVAHCDTKVLTEAINVRPVPQHRMHVESIEGLNVPLNCRHCEDAPCIRICPTGAMGRENKESPVLVESEKCIGCKYCIFVCPFGVIKLNNSGKVVIKCDLCIERLKKDELPACVLSCPTRAIKFKLTEEITDKDRQGSIEHARKVYSSRY